MNVIVHLNYNMRKAQPTELNPENIYAGLNAAFVGGNIGMYSNDISKIWNHDVFVNGSEEEKQQAITCVKQLCCQNNFVIDYAKTLYKPEFPKHVSENITYYTRHKLPAFFEFAKDKTKKQIEERNDSFVNKLYSRIPNKSINTRGLKLGQLNYKDMMSNKNVVCSKEVSDLYDKRNKEYHYMIDMKDEYSDNLRYLACSIRDEFSKFGYSDEMIANMLVEYLYGGNKRYKQLLWFCYGQYIVNNLENNLNVRKTKYIQCIDCGKWVEVDIQSKSTRCSICQKKYKRDYQAALMRKKRKC